MSYQKDGERLRTKTWSDKTTGNGFKLTGARARWGIRKKFFVVRGNNCGNFVAVNTKLKLHSAITAII